MLQEVVVAADTVVELVPEWLQPLEVLQRGGAHGEGLGREGAVHCARRDGAPRFTVTQLCINRGGNTDYLCCNWVGTLFAAHGVITM